jgi:predicted nucleic acid-binding protein
LVIRVSGGRFPKATSPRMFLFSISLMLGLITKTKVPCQMRGSCRVLNTPFNVVVNWGEVYYQVVRRFGEAKAQEIEHLMQTLPITLVEANKELTREAARIKATKRIAYADCFALALARLNKAELYTGNSEFKVVEKEIKIVWL